MHGSSQDKAALIQSTPRVIFTCAGCGTNLVRTTPAAALTFTSFELIARGLRKVRVFEGHAYGYRFLATFSYASCLVLRAFTSSVSIVLLYINAVRLFRY